MSLTFIHGTMASAKTALLLMFADNFSNKKNSIKIAASPLELGKTLINSRAPFNDIKIDFVIKENDNSWIKEINRDVKFLLVDECRFLDRENIDHLKALSKRVNIICYGLLHDFKNHRFKGSKHLTHVADKIVNIPSPCRLCLGNLAECNMRESGDKIVLDGPLMVAKKEINYIPVCSHCYAVKKQQAFK